MNADCDDQARKRIARDDYQSIPSIACELETQVGNYERKLWSALRNLPDETRCDIVDEVRIGILDAIEHRIRMGVEPQRALAEILAAYQPPEHLAQAYRATRLRPLEVARRTFMTNAVLALGGVMSLGIAVPLVTSLVPASAASESEWSPLTADQFAALQRATATPTKVSFNLRDQDGYFAPTESAQFVWAIRTTNAEMRAQRPELYIGAQTLPYSVVNLDLALFSPACPHLGGRYAWIAAQSRFVCPLHGSQFTSCGKHIAGPAQRGLDPLPLREFNGRAQLTWIEFQGNNPNHIILKVG